MAEDGWLQTLTATYIVLSASHLGLQFSLAFIHWCVWRLRKRRAPSAGTGLAALPSISVVYPIYNESPEVLDLVMSKAQQCLYIPGLEVVFVDDGSPNREELLPVYHKYEGDRMRVLLPPENQGKRHAQGIGFRDAKGEVIITVDSDTLIDVEGIRRLVLPLVENPEIGAVTGDVRVQNREESWLSRLIGLRYWLAFNMERAAQSLAGTMLCCSGPFAAYRRHIIDRVLDRYLSQKFLGSPCTYGDDRHLTNLVLQLGYETVFEHEALAYTYVPRTLREYIPQQTRWNKSFYREMLWTLASARHVSLYALWDMLLQPALSVMFTLVIGLVLLRFLLARDLLVLVGYVTMLVAMSALRATYGLIRTRRPEFLLFVVYGFLHVLVLMPVRFKALFTLSDTAWGTRGRKRKSVWRDFAFWAVLYWATALGLASAVWFGSGQGAPPPQSMSAIAVGVARAWSRALPVFGCGLALFVLLATTRRKRVPVIAADT